MIFVDAHVHIYDCFELTKFFDAAYKNFRSAAGKSGHDNSFVGILLLAETSRDNWFQHLSDSVNGKKLPHDKTTGTWKLFPTEDPASLYVRSEGKQDLILVGGRQLVTAEGLELLALATTEIFEDGLELRELLETVPKRGAIPVIPWGVGKWMGKRGKILSKCLSEARRENIFLGDNGGRPSLWPRPRLFEKAESMGVQVLPGSDPLPITDGYQRAGDYGFVLNKRLSDQNPSKFLKAELNQTAHPLETFGGLAGVVPFIRNQIALRLIKG